MLKYSLLLLCFCLSSLCVTQIAIDTGSPYADRGADQYYKHKVIQETPDKVDIQIYYESLCGACMSFHTGRLDKVLRKMGTYLNFKSYPYGNAQMVQQNEKTVVICQHGEAECYGNKLHACAIDHLQNPLLSEFYNSCMMARQWGGNGSTDMDASGCGASMKIDARPIIRCAKSQKGEDLLVYYGQQTALVPDRTYVPFVIINGKVFDGDNDEFEHAVCQAFINPPPPCQQQIKIGTHSLVKSLS